MPRTILPRVFTCFMGAVFLLIGTGFSQEPENQETVKEPFHERTVYVPYEKLHKNFEKNGRGVFLPYEEFQELWKKARASEKPEPKPSVSPVPYMITETVNEAKVVGEIVQVESTVHINILHDGWKEIPLRLNNVALTKASISGEAARIRGNKETGYFLLVEGKKNEKLELLLNYAKSIDKSPGRNSVSFDVPQAPMSRWKVRVPESGVKIDFSPMIAATEIPAQSVHQIQPELPKPPENAPPKEEEKETQEEKEEIVPEERSEPEKQEEKQEEKETAAPSSEIAVDPQTPCGPPQELTDTQPSFASSEAPVANEVPAFASLPPETVLLAFAGGTPTVQIAWTPKSEGATGLDALTSVQIEEKVQIEEGIVRTEAKLDYTISRSQIERLAIAVSKDQKVVEVFDANIRQWTVKTGEDSQTVHVELFEPAKSRQQVVIKLERFIENEPIPLNQQTTRQEHHGKKSVSGKNQGDQEENQEKQEEDHGERENDHGERERDGKNPGNAQGSQGKIGVYSGDTRNRTMISVPVIRAVDVGRQQGVLVVRSAEGLSTEVQKSLGLLQMDTNELPQAVQQQKWDFAYRISTSNYELALSAEKILPRITAKTQAVLQINVSQGNLYFHVDNFFTIERAGVFQLFCDIPEGFVIGNVQGVARDTTQPVQVDSHHLSNEADADGMRRLTVNLSRKAIGQVGLLLSLTKSFNEPDLQSSFGKTVEFKIQPPTVSQKSVQRREGILIIHADNALRVTPTNLQGIQSLPNDQLRTRLTATQPTQQSLIMQATALGFVYGQEHSSLDLKIERRQPQITARQTLRVRIDNGVVKYTDRFNYNIQFSSVKSLRIDIPESIADKIRVVNSPQVRETQNFRETKVVPQPEDVDKGYVAFSFESSGELLGNVNFELTWEEELKQLEVGKKVPISVPQLVPRNVDRSFGHIVISKAPSIDLREENSSGLRSVDPQHDIPAQDRTSDTAAAFEFLDKWSLDLSAVRYQSEELKKTSIEEGFLQLVSVRSSENLTARALYRIRSVKQRLGLALPENAIVNDVRINGKAVALESSGQESGQYLIPLNSVVPDTPFLLELRYSYPGSIREITIPLFPGEAIHERAESESNSGPAIQDMSIAVYIPEDDVLTHFQGPWTPDFRFSYSYPKTLVEYGNAGPEQLIEKIAASVPGAAAPASFPVAGSAYIFSALQPGTTPKDTLQLYSAWERGVRASVFSAIMLAGIVLCPFTWRWRFTLLILFVVACCIVGIFLPTLTLYVSEHEVFAQGVFWVILLWCTVSLFRFARAARKEKEAAGRVLGVGEEDTTPPSPQPPTSDSNTTNQEGGNES